MIETIKLIYSVNHTENKDEQTKELNFILKKNINNNMYILHKALKAQLSDKRFGNAHTKTRSEVRGGGKKPWKQKGTGRARAGSTRSPLWKGGGVIFGPRYKKYNTKINKKEKVLAVKTLIHNKYSNTTVINSIGSNMEKPSTKMILKELNEYGIKSSIFLYQKILLITDQINSNLYLSLRNRPNIEIIQAHNLNSLSLIKAEHIIITSKAIDIMNSIYT